MSVPTTSDYGNLPLPGWMVAWNSATYRNGEPLPEDWYAYRDGTLGEVKVGPWPDRTGWSDAYAMTDGCCMTWMHKASEDMQKAFIFIVFHTLTVGDGVDPRAAHREFLKIGAYRELISPDIPGAE
jgi:hypothetical protein